MRQLLFTLFILCAVLPASGQYNLKITPIDSNIYLYTSYGDVGNYKKIDANAVVVVSGNDAILFDTPWDDAQAAQLISYVQDSLHKNILMAIITHAHIDRTGGINTMHKNNIPTLCYELTAEEAPQYGHSVPEHIFYSTDTSIQCGNIEVEAYYPGAGHTIDNIVLYVPSKQFLYGGCFIKSGFSNTIGNTENADMAAWPVSVKRMDKHFAREGIKTVIPGHGSWKSDKAIENTLRLLDEDTSGKY